MKCKWSSKRVLCAVEYSVVPSTVPSAARAVIYDLQ